MKLWLITVINNKGLSTGTELTYFVQMGGSTEEKALTLLRKKYSTECYGESISVKEIDSSAYISSKFMKG